MKLHHRIFKSQYFAGTAFQVIDKVVRMVGQFVFLIYLADYLGPAQMGVFGYAQSFAGLAGIIVPLGLTPIVVRELVRANYKPEAIMGSSLWLRVVTSVISYGLLIGLALMVEGAENETYPLVLIAALTFFLIPGNVLVELFQAKVKTQYTAWSDMASFLCALIVRFYLIHIGASLWAFVLMVPIEIAINCVGRYWFYRQMDSRPMHWYWHTPTAKALLRESLWLLLSSAMIVIYTKSDKFMLFHLLDDSIAKVATGNYDLSVRLYMPLIFFPAMLTGTLFPAIIKAKEQSEQLYWQRLKMLYAVLAGGGYLIVGGLTVVAIWLVPWVTPKYVETPNILMIHAWSLLFICIGQVGSKFFIIEGYSHLALIRNAAGAVVNIGLNFILIPRYGATGAAIATLISFVLSMHLMLMFIPPMRRCFWEQNKALLLIPLFRFLFQKMRSGSKR